jgi:tRNA U34 5-carboxymethylaminomethyl modifying GTPase MnmE/TrmE
MDREVDQEVIQISAKHHYGLERLKSRLVELIRAKAPSDQVIINNIRHKHALDKTLESLVARY